MLICLSTFFMSDMPESNGSSTFQESYAAITTHIRIILTVHHSRVALVIEPYESS